MISPELAKVNTKYAFTLNPCDEFQHMPTFGGLHVNRLKLVRDNVLAFFEKNIRFCAFFLNVEVSRLGRVHYHGVLQILLPLEFYLYDIPLLLKRFQIEIDTISETKVSEIYPSWDAYCTKQRLITCANPFSWSPLWFQVNGTAPKAADTNYEAIMREDMD